MIRISCAPVDLGRVVSLVQRPQDGAVAVFYGVVRDHSRGRRTTHLEYEAYAPMAEKVMEEIAAEARERWDVGEVAVVHRIGRLEVGEISVAIAVGSEHRAAGLEAVGYIIDGIKRRAPIWKKEVGEDGSRWVEGTEPEDGG